MHVLLQSKAMNLYEACLTLLQVYSKNNLGRQRIDVTAEEEQYQDLLLIMELLTNLLSKEFIDFSDTGKVRCKGFKFHFNYLFCKAKEDKTK